MKNLSSCEAQRPEIGECVTFKTAHEPYVCWILGAGEFCARIVAHLSVLRTPLTARMTPLISLFS